MSEFSLRLVCIAIAILVWFITQRLIAKRANSTSGMYDYIHLRTERINRYLLANPKAADSLLILSSLLIDLLTLYVLYQSLFGASFKPFIGLFILLLGRQISQFLTALPPPEGIIWRSPGFPSLFVTYGVSNDLFFSGHTALAVYGAMQLASRADPLLSALAITIAVFEIVVVLLLRAHWTVDVIGGAFAALSIGYVLSL